MSGQVFCALLVTILCIIHSVSSVRQFNDNAFIAASNNNGDSCNRQYFNQNSFVCACNLNSCPPLEPIKRVPEGYIYSWESSRDQYRFHWTFLQVESLKRWTISSKVHRKSPTIFVDLDLDDRRQTIKGFGAAFTDSAGSNLASLPTSLSDRILSDYFDSNSGLNYSVARVPIGGTDFSDRPYTLNDGHDGDLAQSLFALQPEDFLYKIPMIKKALQIKGDGGLKLLGSLWSPPAWMKTNNRIDGSGFIKGQSDGLFYQSLAEYYVKWLQAYENEGIKIWGITTGNEPTNALRNSDFFFNCLGMTPDQLRYFVANHLGPTLAKYGYGTDKLEVLLYDDIRDFLKNYTENVLSDPLAASYVTGLAFHWYKISSDPHYEDLIQVHNNFPKHFLFATEASEGFERYSTRRAELGNWTRAETYAMDIIEDLNSFTTGWLDWNLVLNTKGGPSWAENWTDGLILINPNITTYYRNPMFYSMGHFSRFLPPGSTYIGHNVYGNSKDLFLVSFIDPSNQLVMVILNQGDDQIDLLVNNFAEDPVPVIMDGHSIKTLVTPVVDFRANKKPKITLKVRPQTF